MSKVFKKVNVLGKLFSGGEKPKLPDYGAQTAKEEKDRQAIAARLKAEQVERGATGRASTLLTGGKGLLDDDTEARRVLMRK